MSTASEPIAYLDPRRVNTKRFRFSVSDNEIAQVLGFVGPLGEDDPQSGLAETIVRRTSERLSTDLSGFGVGVAETVADILQAGGGNCISHSVVAAVGLRASGVPTRLVHENVYTTFSLIRVPALLMQIGPTLNNHVWLEVQLDRRWVPGDPQLSIFGDGELLEKRVLRGTRWPPVRIMGVPYAEEWQFPLRIRALDPEGTPAQDRTQAYLIDALCSPGTDVPAAWRRDMSFFSHQFDWNGRPGARLLWQRSRLRRMGRVLKRLGERQPNVA